MYIDVVESEAVPTTFSLRSQLQRSSPIRDLLRLTEAPGMLSLAGGLPAPDRFPVGLLTDAFGRAMARSGATGPPALQYAPTEGVGAFREHLAADAGVQVDNVLVTTGSQQGLDLLARVMCDPGDVVVAEDPSYLGALQAFRSAQAHVVGAPGDAAGLDVDTLAAMLGRGLRPRVVYVCPNFANPTGSTLGGDRRLTLVDLALRYGFLVVEDDPYAALRFTGQDLPPIAGPERPVVRLGTASKVLAPGLRVGWMTGPASLVAAAALAKQATDLHTSSLNQLMVLEAVTDKRFQPHVARTTKVYHERARALCQALRTHLGGQVEFADPTGGMFVWARLPGVSTESLLERAIHHDVAFVPGSAFAADDEGGSRDDWLRLSFATLDPGQLDQACHRLGKALGDLHQCVGR